jgi:hypothetical protein
MWLLNFIPTETLRWAIHLLVVLSALGYIYSHFTVYKKILVPLTFILCLFSIYCEGGYLVEKEWRLKVSQMEEKLKIAETKSKEVNTVIQTKIVEKIKVVKETTDANVQVVEKIVTKYDNICTLSNAAIVLHDSASQNTVSPSTGSSIEGTSNVKASELLTRVTENYGLYYQVREQVLGWQLWYNEQKKIFEDIK